MALELNLSRLHRTAMFSSRNMFVPGGATTNLRGRFTFNSPEGCLIQRRCRVKGRVRFRVR